MVPNVPISQRFDFRVVSFLRAWFQLSLSLGPQGPGLLAQKSAFRQANLKAELKGHCTEDLVNRGDDSAGKVWAR